MQVNKFSMNKNRVIPDYITSNNYGTEGRNNTLNFFLIINRQPQERKLNCQNIRTDPYLLVKEKMTHVLTVESACSTFLIMFMFVPPSPDFSAFHIRRFVAMFIRKTAKRIALFLFFCMFCSNSMGFDDNI